MIASLQGHVMLKNRFNLLVKIFSLLLLSQITLANTNHDEAALHTLFSSWTKTFNEKKFPQVCDLFAPSVIANYQGAPTKNHAKICQGFQTIFQEKDTLYHNDFKIHHIYQEKNLAAVRITWYLTTYKHGKKIAFTQEEGLDVLQKQANGKWQIVNFIAYPIVAETDTTG